MAGSRIFGIICFVSLTLVGIINASPVELPDKFSPDGNRLDCPAAHQTKYSGPSDGKWGVLCGYDTKSTTYAWEPIFNVNFQQCIAECAKKDQCTLVTFTGTCYLKKSDKGEGFVKTGSQQNRVAVNLARWNGDTY